MLRLNSPFCPSRLSQAAARRSACRWRPSAGDEPAERVELRRQVTDAVRGRTQAEWVEVFEGTDACVAPVLPMTEAFHHPHLVARRTFVERDGVTEPAPAPRFSRTPPSLTTPPPAEPGQDTAEALTAWGVTGVDRLLESGAAVQA